MMNDFFLLLISALFVFRAAELIAVDNGPFHMFKWLRKAMAKRGPVIGELVSCQYCVGAHVAMWLTAFLAWQRFIEWRLTPLWWIGIAGGAIMILRSVRPRE